MGFKSNVKKIKANTSINDLHTHSSKFSYSSGGIMGMAEGMQFIPIYQPLEQEQATGIRP